MDLGLHQHTGPQEGIKKGRTLTECVLMSNVAFAWDPANDILKKTLHAEEHHVGTKAVRSYSSIGICSTYHEHPEHFAWLQGVENQFYNSI